MKIVGLFLVALFVSLQSFAQLALQRTIAVKFSTALMQDEMVKELILKPATNISIDTKANEASVLLINPETATIQYIETLAASNSLVKISDDLQVVNTKATCKGADCFGKKIGLPGSIGSQGPKQEGGGGGLDIFPDNPNGDKSHGGGIIKCKKTKGGWDCNTEGGGGGTDIFPNSPDGGKPHPPKCIKTAHGLFCF